MAARRALRLAPLVSGSRVPLGGWCRGFAGDAQVSRSSGSILEHYPGVPSHGSSSSGSSSSTTSASHKQPAQVTSKKVNAILASSGSQNTAPDLVDTLRNLAAIAREADPQDVDLILNRPAFELLLQDLIGTLPQDTNDPVDWDPVVLVDIVAALQDLRVAVVDPQFGIRLANALIRAAPRFDMELLVHNILKICHSGIKGLQPGDYTIWVASELLKQLCQTSAEGGRGPLSMVRLVPILHGFAGNKALGRNPVVVQRVLNGLQDCSIRELVQLLQSYHGVPGGKSVVDAVLSRVTPQGLEKISILRDADLPQLVVLSAAHVAQTPADAPRLALAIVRQVVELAALARDVDPLEDVELLAQCLAATSEAFSAGDQLRKGGEESLAVAGAFEAEFAKAVELLANRLHNDHGSQGAETICLALQGMLFHTRGATALSVSQLSWLQPLMKLVPSRLDGVAMTQLVNLAEGLAKQDAWLGEDGQECFTGVYKVARRRIREASLPQFGRVCRSFAMSSLLDENLFDAFNAQAVLANNAPDTATTTNILWAMAVAGSKSSVTWQLATSALEGHFSTWPRKLRADIVEAVRVREMMVDKPWDPESAASKAIEAWGQTRTGGRTTAPEADVELVKELLSELGVEFTEGEQDGSGLYVMPIYLVKEKVVLDLTLRATHPVSRKKSGETILSHFCRNAIGLNVLTIPSSIWSQLAKDAEQKNSDVKAVQKKWLQQKIDALVSERDRQQRPPKRVASDRADKTSLSDVRRPQAKAQPQAKAKAKAMAKTQVAVQAAAWRPEGGWGHEGGRPVADFKVGERVAGKVTNVYRRRVWVDIGAVKDAVFRALVETPSVNDVYDDLRVKEVNLQHKWILLESPRASTRRPEQGWTHPQGRPLGELKVGEIVKGTVTNVARRRVFVDVGAERDACFESTIPDQYKKDDMIEHLVIKEVDTERKTVLVHSPDAASDKAA